MLLGLHLFVGTLELPKFRKKREKKQTSHENTTSPSGHHNNSQVLKLGKFQVLFWAVSIATIPLVQSV